MYAPRASNDRLLLGHKGSLNEYEFDLLRQRSLEARRAMAKRGELIVNAPIGFKKTEDQRLEKDPDRPVQEAIRLVFDQFERIGSSDVAVVPRTRIGAAMRDGAWRGPLETADLRHDLSVIN